ncbi:hypothetical protein [Cohnella silvisoli]|uniref:DUF4145 domain-containing protein n=1 Tax=Cohnella silvisoli TaxID=2873699 RepID=A0ABV1L2Q0_9BACL|nr:hypothetical protein [Cohnella silvisoli]MCD9025878.1 hypothetical protein [Cohnella silvisoli]
MKYSLFDNGIDSFKAAFSSIQKIKDLVDGGYHHYKDAILSINHANEVLFKHMLKQRLELLIFEDMKTYISAKSDLKRSGKSNVLEVNPNLKTVNLFDAMKRLRDLCDVEIPEMFFSSILYLNNLRNKIMHYEIELHEEEIENVRKMLESCYTLSIEFFESQLGGIGQALENARYELTSEDIADILAEQEMYEKIREDYLDRLDGEYLAIDEALEDEFEGKATY